ncbi:hypothetical protein GmHk_06G016927 [Glycine max]|nr:hypothetical protein GmHk_06G016927 [Glycine max]
MGSDGCRETRGTGTREATCKPRQDFNIQKEKERGSLFKIKSHVLSLFTHSEKFRSSRHLLTLLFFFPSHPPSLPIKAPNFAHHFYSKSQKEVIFGVVKRTSTLWDFEFQIVMAAQLIHD